MLYFRWEYKSKRELGYCMRKRIGIFIGEIAQEYQKLVAKVVSKRANQLGYDTVFICSYGSYNEDILYAEGEKSCIYLPDISSFDGLIITEDVLDIPGMDDELYGIVQKEAKGPVVYLRTSRPGCFSVLPENKKSMENMVRHFTDDHGFTDICYMSGKKGTEDAKERLAGYMTVMEEKGITVTDDMIFHGDYWRNKGKEAIDWFMQNRETYPQAIVCANDYMALSICEELKLRGVKVPEEVCVSGFDFIEEARVSNPTLTSLEVDFETMIVKSVDIIHDSLCGKECEKINKVNAKICLHSSCGCGTQYKHKNIIKIVDMVHKQVEDTKNLLISATDYQDSFEFDEYMAVADKYRRFIRAEKTYFCFCDEEDSGYNEVENDSVFTDQVVLRRTFDGNKPAEKSFIKFPRRKILPDELWKEDECNNFCVFAIHFKNVVFGYLVTDIPQDRWFDIYTQGYLMTLANAIENIEVHKQMEKLETIKAIYQKDPLTGIYNRRGFDKLFQESFSSAKHGGNDIALASIDMDNLKTINDTYGHSEGDKALICLAKALNSVMKEIDYCARIGGDEFAAVIVVDYPGRVNEFRSEFVNALKEESRRMEILEVEASVGICESKEQSVESLVTCVQLADRRMYEDKRNRKAGRQK